MFEDERCPRCGLDVWEDHESRPKNVQPDGDEWKCLVCGAVMCSNQVISAGDKVDGEWPILSHENFQGEAKGTLLVEAKALSLSGRVQSGRKIGSPIFRAATKTIYVCGPVVFVEHWNTLDEDSKARIVTETKLIKLIEKSPLTTPAVLGKSMEDKGGREA